MSYLSGIIGIIAIAIVIWDHFIDDRLLTKRVRIYYDNIEKFIFTFYKYEILEEKISKKEISDNERANLIELIKKNRIDQDFYRNTIIQNFDEFGKYLGFTSSGKSKFYVEFYIEEEKYILEQEGAIQKYVFTDNVVNNPNFLILGSDKRYNLGDKEIGIINKFLENLKKYWKENYTRRKIFRGNLQGKVDFRKLIELNS